MSEVEGLIAHKANNDVASIVASVQREPVPPATVVDAVKPDVKALLKTKGPSHNNLKSKNGFVSDIKIGNHLDKAFSLVCDTANKVSTATTEPYPLLHKYREDIKRPDGARACTLTRCGVTLPRSSHAPTWTCLSPGAAVYPPLKELLRSTLCEIAHDDDDNGSSDDDH